MREREEIDQREEGVKVEGEGKEGSGQGQKLNPSSSKDQKQNHLVQK